MAIGLVLGGGAPNLPLMTGALLALDEAGVEFKVITTTGAGMVVGLLYAAPRETETLNTWKKARRARLRHTRDWGIDDMIYEMVPINYKIFQKPGARARAFSHATNPFLWAIPRDNRRQRLLGDTLALMASAMSPSDLGAKSKGLCQPPPWIELLVDFDKLEKNLAERDTKFRLSAYCIEDADEKTFHRNEITVDHFKAALAMPFIYAPYKLKDKDGTWKAYLEGSAFKTLQLDPEKVMSEGNGIDTVIFFDIMGNRHLIGEPRWLIDAWGKSIVAPLTRLAELGLEDFKLRREENRKAREIKELDELLGLPRVTKQDNRLFELKRDLHMKNRQLSELMDLKRLPTYSGRDRKQFKKKFDAYIDTYMKGQKIKNPEELVGKVPTSLNREIKKLEERLKSLKGRISPLAGGVRKGTDDHQFDRTELLRMPFRKNIKEDDWTEVLDWSHSNMERLFDIGYQTGQEFCVEHEARLKRSMKHNP